MEGCGAQGFLGGGIGDLNLPRGTQARGSAKSLSEYTPGAALRIADVKNIGMDFASEVLRICP